MKIPKWVDAVMLRVLLKTAAHSHDWRGMKVTYTVIGRGDGHLVLLSATGKHGDLTAEVSGSALSVGYAVAALGEQVARATSAIEAREAKLREGDR